MALMMALEIIPGNAPERHMERHTERHLVAVWQLCMEFMRESLRKMLAN